MERNRKMRLIDADALKSTIRKYEFNAPNERYKQGGECVLNFYMPKIIDDAPTIEAEPVRHGKWVQSRSPGGSPLCNCSVCGDSAISQDNDWGDVIDYHETDFCPNCGARMNGGANIP